MDVEVGADELDLIDSFAEIVGIDESEIGVYPNRIRPVMKGYKRAPPRTLTWSTAPRDFPH